MRIRLRGVRLIAIFGFWEEGFELMGRVEVFI
jgi:hypothetical protein